MKRYERRHEPLAPLSHFMQRLVQSWLTAFAVFMISLFIGIWGYAHFEHMAFDDAFVNAAMILGGMGPVNPLTTHEGKIFAGCYALFSGIAFVAVLGFMIAPVAHRLMHKFHLDGESGP